MTELSDRELVEIMFRVWHKLEQRLTHIDILLKYPICVN